MATFGEIQDNIASYLNRSDLTATIKLAVQRAVKYYENIPFWFNEANDSFVTVSGTKYYTLSATVGYSKINQVMLTYNGSRFEVSEKNSEELEALDPTQLRGQPLWYAQFNGGIFFYPIPSGSYTVSYNYIVKTATLSASTDSNIWTTNAEDLIEARSMWFVASRRMRNPTLAQSAKADEIEALRNLTEESTDKMASGKLTATNF